MGRPGQRATAQKLEIVPPPDATMGTRAEYQVARREAKLDNEVKGSAPADKGKGKSKEKGREKGKEKGKGRGKETEGKKSS